MTKTTFNRILKELGYTFVKVSRGTFATPKCYTDYYGKKTKGIRGGSYGPMTITNQWRNVNEKVTNAVKVEMNKLGIISIDGSDFFQYIVQFGRKEFKVTFSWEAYPTYDRSQRLDPSYLTQWLTCDMEEIKKKDKV